MPPLPVPQTPAAGMDDLASLEADLRAGLAAGAFNVHWQPMVACRTGDLVGFEALVRWDRPGHGPVPPSSFVPVLERLGLFRRFDTSLLRKACAAAAGWNGHVAAVNLSAHWFQGPGLVSMVADALERSRIDPARLELEVSEAIILGAKATVLHDLNRLKDLGVRLSLDDFGSGHASLGFLQDMPFDKLKLDPAFVSRLGQCRRTEAIVRAVLQMGKALGITVCAEGVERPEQLAILQAYGCDQAQGYLIGHPEQALPDVLDFYDRLDRTRLFMGTTTGEDPDLPTPR